jgi:hypothetical protein
VLVGILRSPLSHRRRSLQPNEALHVVDGEPDLESRTSESDGSDEEAHSVLLLGEDVLDTSPHGRLAIIGPTDRGGHRATDGLLAMDLAGKAVR